MPVPNPVSTLSYHRSQTVLFLFLGKRIFRKVFSPDKAENGADDPGEGGGLAVRGRGDVLLTVGAGHDDGAESKAGRLHVLDLKKEQYYRGPYIV